MQNVEMTLLFRTLDFSTGGGKYLRLNQLDSATSLCTSIFRHTALSSALNQVKAMAPSHCLLSYMHI